LFAYKSTKKKKVSLCSLTKASKRKK